MSFPTVTVEVALATDPTVAPVWTDVSSWLLSDQPLLIDRGGLRLRPGERYKAGESSLLLDNSDGRFDPNNPSGPYFGQLLPMRRIRVRAVWDSVTYDLFHGYVEDWNPADADPAVSAIPLRAVDGFLPLSLAALGTPWHVDTGALGPTHWWRLGESSGQTAYDAVGNEHGLYTGTVTLGAESLISSDADTAIELAGAGHVAMPVAAVPTSGSYSIVVALRRNGAPATGETVVLTRPTPGADGASLEVDTSGKVRWGVQGAGVRTSAGVATDDAAHLIVATYDGAGAITLYVDGDPAGTTAGAAFASLPAQFTVGGHISLAGAPTTRFTGRVDEVMVFDGVVLSAADAATLLTARDGRDAEQSGDRVSWVLDRASWPAADRAIDAGQSVLQATTLSTNALDHIQTVEVTEAGRFFISRAGIATFQGRHTPLTPPHTTPVATFGDGPGQLHYTELERSPGAQELIYNEVQTSSQGQPAQLRTAPTSRDKFFPRRLEVSGLLTSSAAELRDYADWLLDRHKDPQLRFVRLVIDPTDDPAGLYPIVLAAEIGQRFTVERQPPGAAYTLSQDVVVEGVAHRIGDGDPLAWETVLALSPAEARAYWVLGTSELGSTTRLAF